MYTRLVWPFFDELTIRHLLTFHSKFKRFVTPEEMMQEYMINPGSRVLPNMLDRIKKVGLEDKPGLKHNYANVHTILLGLVLENVFGKQSVYLHHEQNWCIRLARRFLEKRMARFFVDACMLLLVSKC